MSRTNSAVKSTCINIRIFPSFFNQLSCTEACTAIAKLIDCKLSYNKSVFSCIFNCFINKSQLWKCFKNKYINATFLKNINYINILFFNMLFFNHIFTRNRPNISCYKHICPLYGFPCNVNGIFNIISHLIKSRSKTHGITCKCISSDNLSTSFNIFFMN